MSGDEVIVLIASVILGPIGWAIWFYRLAVVARFGKSKASIKILAAVVVGCGLLLVGVLRMAASPDVRDAPQYLLLYLLLGLAWLRASAFFFAYAGLSVRDDVVERRNTAAVPAVSGALLGVTCCYAGGNVGAGPGWWVVVFSAGLATAALAAIWIAADRIAHVNDTITIERDLAAGIRLGGLLAAGGLILGRAVAGDWESAGQTITDFGRVAWVVVPLAAIALVIDRTFKPTTVRPQPPLGAAGVLPAMIYVSLAEAYLFFLGWPV